MKRLRRAARKLAKGLTTAALATATTLSGFAVASGDARTISFYNIHTKERLTVLYKKDGRYVPEALEKINWILRDWRINKAIKIDPQTIDIAWEMHTELQSREPIHIICGYRSHETNEMLRRTRGGQASQSQHITGKAIDIAFPDIPLRRLRYSAMIRERGGVGYYPTSAIPFVHVDSARVRHWPRMSQEELALLFPNGKTRYVSTEERAITQSDVARAKRNNPELARQVAQYFELRSQPKAPVLVASAEQPAATAEVLPWAPAPKPATRPTSPSPSPAGQRVAALDPAPKPERAPQLVSAPKLVERSSTFKPGLSTGDRRALNELMTLASYTPSATADVAEGPASGTQPRLTAAPRLAERPRPALKPVVASIGALSAGTLAQLAREAAAPEVESEAAGPAAAVGLPAAEVKAFAAESGTDGAGRRFDWGSGWVAAPAYDEDHPEELAYQPFPIMPLLTETSSPDDPALARMTHPNVQRTLDMLDDEGLILPMRLRPGAQTAELLWAQEFRGEAVDLKELDSSFSAPPAAALAERSVKTSRR